MIFDSAIRKRYECMLRWPDVNAKTINPMINGSKNPETNPVRTLSYFSGTVIF
jgi:hypothetical protein